MISKSNATADDFRGLMVLAQHALAVFGYQLGSEYEAGIWGNDTQAAFRNYLQALEVAVELELFPLEAEPEGNLDIVAAATNIYNYPPSLLKDNSGLCLALVRQVLEAAFELNPYDLYRYRVTHWTQPEGYKRESGHWANDAEASFRKLGWQIPNSDIRPGDVVCIHNTALVTPALWPRMFSTPYKNNVPIGHIAVYLGEMEFASGTHEVVLENVNPAFRSNKSIDRNGALSLTSWSAFPAVTSVFRVPKLTP